jgi:CHASE2 domain-containing sensor protein
VVVNGRLEPIQAAGAGYEATGVTLKQPIDLLVHSHVHYGIEGFPVDPDGYIRHIDLLQAGPGGLGPFSATYPSFALALASVAEHRSIRRITQGLPTTGMLINYLGSQDAGSGFSLPEVQFYGLATGEDATRPFRNKTVIVQYSEPVAGEPIIPTPVGQLYGGAQEANTLATILDRDPIRPAGDPANDLIIVSLALLTTVVAMRLPMLWSLLTTLLLAIGYVVLTASLFREFNVWIEVVSPLAAIAVCFVVASALRVRAPGRAAASAG